MMLNHTTCCNLSFNYRYVSLFSHISCHFVFVEITPVHVPLLPLPLPVRNFQILSVSRIFRNQSGLFNSHFFKVFWPLIWNPILGAQFFQFYFLLILPFKILYLEDENLKKSFCCFFRSSEFQDAFFLFLKLSRFELDSGFNHFFLIFPFFSMFPWVSLLTWFSPKDK
jgi:hypothetical protein